MHVIGKGYTAWFDVDDTLVMWNWPEDETVETWIELDPWKDGTIVKLAVNTAMVDQMKKHSERGHPVIVWSAGGWEWAETVVKQLNLEKYVSLVVEKPSWIYDDKPPSHFMPKEQWLGRKEWLPK